MLRSFHRLVVCLIALLGTAAIARGQNVTPPSPYTPNPYKGISGIRALVARNFVPVNVRMIDGPNVVGIGQRSAFTVVANVETATLPMQCRWDFGDGHTAVGFSTSHVFDKPGDYTVTAVVSNAKSRDTVSKVVTVVADALGDALVPEGAGSSATPSENEP